MSGCRGTEIPAETRRTIAGKRGNNTRSIDLTNPVIGPVADQDIAQRIYCDTGW